MDAGACWVGGLVGSFIGLDEDAEVNFGSISLDPGCFAEPTRKKAR